MLAAQAPFDLSHEVVRKPQVIEGLLEGRGGVLRLTAVACEALLRGAAATLSSFGLFFRVRSSVAERYHSFTQAVSV